MQGLAMAVGRPLIGVSALDALAYLAGHRRDGVDRTRIAAWMDAWRQEVFSAVYEEDHEVVPPVVAKPESLLAGFLGQFVLFTGDGALAYQRAIRAVLGDRAHFTDPVSPVLGGAVAELAARAYRAGERPPPHAIQPIYARRSDTELTGSVRPV
jgi:tRNA threonylcarbamoyladenosine biosynthesis protein TsaB